MEILQYVFYGVVTVVLVFVLGLVLAADMSRPNGGAQWHLIFLLPLLPVALLIIYGGGALAGAYGRLRKFFGKKR